MRAPFLAAAFVATAILAVPGASASVIGDGYVACAEATGAPECYTVYRAAYDACILAFYSPAGPGVPPEAWLAACFG